MTLVQQISTLTFIPAVFIALFGGWFAFNLALENYKDVENRAFMQIVVGASIVFIFIIALISLSSYKELIQLGY